MYSIVFIFCLLFLKLTGDFFPQPNQPTSSIISYAHSAHLSILTNLCKCYTINSITTPQLPDRLLIGYANWGQCDQKIIHAVENGLNVIIWFSLTLSKNSSTNLPQITGAIPDLDCVAQTVKTIRDRGYSVLHSISIGGWNTPLPDTTFSSKQWFEVFHEWNTQTVSRPHLGWAGFQAIDWDPEGNDDTTKKDNKFTIQRMKLIGEMSVIAKQHGYIVSIAPAQSYLDVNTTVFDLNADHPPAFGWKPNFRYHGRNLYAYWLVKYGQTELSTGKLVPTFDWVSLQLYEGWSEANYNIAEKGVDIGEYLKTLIHSMMQGWRVDFSQVPELGLQSQMVNVQPRKLVIGLANGWTSSYPPTHKFLLLPTPQLQHAIGNLSQTLTPRGFMFWNIADEGRKINGRQLYLAKELSGFLEL